MKVLYIFSVFLIISMAYLMSCSNEDANPKTCDGSLSLAAEPPINPTTCTPSNGSLTVTATGGNAPYQYSLNGGTKQASATFSGLSAGTYSVTVFDNNDCEDEILNITLDFPDSDLNLAATPSSDNSCSTNNGTISLVGSAGSGGYQYKIASLAYSATTLYSNLAPGTYSASVKDSGGCEKTISVLVAQGNTGTTYTGNIQSIINANCSTNNSSCHGSGASGRPELDTFSKVSTNASAIFSRTNGGSMPPAGKLDQSLINQIKCWIDDAKPQ